jgi:hypothetical protein
VGTSGAPESWIKTQARTRGGCTSERAAAAASDLAAGGEVSSPGTSFESNFDEMQAANELTYDDDVDVDQDVSAAQNMGT